MQTGLRPPPAPHHHSHHHGKVRKTAESNHAEKFSLWLTQKNASNSHQMGDGARRYFGFSVIASLVERLLRLMARLELNPGLVSGGKTIVRNPLFCTLRRRQQKPLFVELRYLGPATPSLFKTTKEKPLQRQLISPNPLLLPPWLPLL